MTFTQYLRHLISMGLAPSFWPLFDRVAWPAHSTRLADFEEYLHAEFEVGWEVAILELRTLWSRWAEGPAASADLHADRALLAWRDYAIHLRGCELVEDGPCPRAEALLARAIQESHFHDLTVLPPDRVPCEDPDDAEARYRRDVVADEVLGLPSVEEFFHQRRRLSPLSPSVHPHQAVATLTQEHTVTFTDFLKNTHRTGPRPTFIHLARHDDLWPSKSDRLEEFESFLLSRLEEESAEVIPELRELWHDYANEVGRAAGKHDLDLALAAWGDYARHLQSCSGSPLEPCGTAHQLLDRAIDASSFDDVNHAAYESLPCEGTDDADRDDVGELDFDDKDDWEPGEWERPADLS